LIARGSVVLRRWVVFGLVFAAILLMILLLALGRGTAPPTAELAPYIPPKGYVCQRAANPLVIDGKLDDPSWQEAPWTDDFVDIEGDAKPKPRYRTRAKMLWDDTYFYIAAQLDEPHVWATFTQHDSYIFQEDNDFEVFIDPDGDHHAYGEFEINALNTSWDLLLTMPYRDGGKALDSWEIAGLKTAVHVGGTLNDASDQDTHWTVEMAFPWKVLCQLAKVTNPPMEGAQWRVNFSRVEWQHELKDGKYRRVPDTAENNWVWSPQGVVDMHRPELWGYVQFTALPPGQATFKPDPAGRVRHLLMQAYHAQRRFHKQHQRWATSLAELGLPQLTDPPLTLETTGSLYEITAPLTLPDGTKQRWHVRQDSRVWRDLR
jgi:hypothetical protein